MSVASQIADMLGECIAEKAELQASHAELLAFVKGIAPLLDDLNCPVTADLAKIQIERAEKLK